MNAQEHPITRKTLPVPTGTQLLWVAVGMVLVAALAIATITQLTPATKVASLPGAQLVPDAAAQAVDRSFHTPQTSDYPGVKVDRSFHTPQTSDYPGVSIDRSFHTPQTSDYPGVKVDRSFHTPQTSDYPGVKVDRSFHTPQTSDYPSANSRPAPRPTPDSK